jgi:hypothetical protein
MPYSRHISICISGNISCRTPGCSISRPVETGTHAHASDMEFVTHVLSADGAVRSGFPFALLVCSVAILRKVSRRGETSYRKCLVSDISTALSFRATFSDENVGTPFSYFTPHYHDVILRFRTAHCTWTLPTRDVNRLGHTMPRGRPRIVSLIARCQVTGSNKTRVACHSLLITLAISVEKPRSFVASQHVKGLCHLSIDTR